MFRPCNLTNAENAAAFSAVIDAVEACRSLAVAMAILLNIDSAVAAQRIAA